MKERNEITQGEQGTSVTAQEDRKPGITKKSSSGAETKAGSGMQAETKFGAVKVHAPILSQVVDTRTYVVTNRTTCKELVAMVLAGYKIICEDQALFYLTLERSKKTYDGRVLATYLVNFKSVDFRETSTYSYEYPGTDKSDIDIDTNYQVTVDNNTAYCQAARHSQAAGDAVALPTRRFQSASKSVFLTEKTTGSGLIKLFLDNLKVEESTDKYALYEVDVDSKGSHELCLDHKPLDIQDQWIDPHEFYFEIRKKGARDPKEVRRSHSLNSLEEASSSHRVLNIRELRKAHNPRRRRCRRPPEEESPSATSDNVQSIPGKDSTMSKLKDSLSKLREHLDSLQKRRDMPYSSDDTHTPESYKSIQNPTSQHTNGSNTHLGSPDPDTTTSKLYETRQTSIDTNDYDTGDTSMNESDAGSTCASVKTHRSSTNDSAYASDRKSYNTHARRRRHGSNSSYTSDGVNDQSSPEGAVKKSYSMLELDGHGDVNSIRPLRIKSASHAQGRTRQRRIRGDLAASVEDISTVRHNSLSESQYGIQTMDIIHRSNSLRNNYERRKHRPTSADEVFGVGSLRASYAKGHSRSRRSLPKTPEMGDLEERKRLMPLQALQRAKELNIYKDDTDPDGVVSDFVMTRRGSNASVPDTHSEAFVPIGVSKAAKYSSETNLNSPAPAILHRKEPPPDYDTVMSSRKRDSILNNVPHRKSDCQSASSSQDALKRIINDLRDAAGHRSYDSQPPSLNASRSSSAAHDHSISWSRDSYHNASVGSGPVGLDYSNGFSPDSERSQSGSGSYYERVRISNGDKDDLKVFHPHLYKVLQSCDIIPVCIDFKDRNVEGTLDKKMDNKLRIELFESVFVDSQKGTGREKRPIFRSPSGRRPVIGRRKGAFQPVNSEKGQVLSLVAVDAIDNDDFLGSDSIQEGDYVIEVNGSYVVNSKLESVQQELDRCKEKLLLVVARPKSCRPPDPGASTDRSMKDTTSLPDATIEKELEKLKIKYNNLKEDAGKSLDMIAEMKLEEKRKSDKLEQYERKLEDRETKIRSLEKHQKNKEERLAEWRHEANQRNVEIAKLKFESRQKDDRIAQLRKLLIQQTEVMQLQGFGNEPINFDEYDDEDVSAV